MGRIINRSNWKKAYYYLKRNGLSSTLSAVMERAGSSYHADYCYQERKEEELERQRRIQWKNPVCFSILVPAYETKDRFLEQLIRSLLDQTYPHWELLILDAGRGGGVREKTKSAGDRRIRYIPLEKNAGISENSQAGLAFVKGDYVGLLDHDDFLTPDALYEMAEALKKGKEEGREYAFLYSDEDKCGEFGESFFEPHFKPEFNLDLLLTNNYICHFLVMEKNLLLRLGFRKTYDGAQDYDLILRAVSCLLKQGEKPEERVAHIPRVLYHWRCHEASTAVNPMSKSYAYEAGRRALEDFLQVQGWKGRVSHMQHVGFYRITYEGGVFSQRPDIAAMGGKRIQKRRILATAFSQKGEPLYEGLKENYGGYMHRAVLAQNTDCLDIEQWKVNPACRTVVERLLQEEAKEEEGMEKAKRICERLRREGYRLYWDPEWIIRR